jgi:hypothetical protein
MRWESLKPVLVKLNRTENRGRTGTRPDQMGKKPLDTVIADKHTAALAANRYIEESK